MKATCNAPRSCGRIIQLSAIGDAAICIPASSDQNLAVRQQCSRVRMAGFIEMASRNPSPRGWVIEFCAVNLVAIESPSNQDLAIG